MHKETLPPQLQAIEDLKLEAVTNEDREYLKQQEEEINRERREALRSLGEKPTKIVINEQNGLVVGFEEDVKPTKENYDSSGTYTDGRR